MNAEAICAYYQARPHYWRAFHIRRWQIMFPLLESASSILDVGCGYGDLAWVCAENGLHVPFTGIDIVPEHIAFASQQFQGGGWILGDFLSQDFRDQTFDTVVSICFFSGEGHDEASVESGIVKMWSLASRQVILLENNLLSAVHSACEKFPGEIRRTVGGELLACLRK